MEYVIFPANTRILILMYSLFFSTNLLAIDAVNGKLGLELSYGHVDVQSKNSEEIDKKGPARGVVGFWRSPSPKAFWSVGIGAQGADVRGSSRARGVRQRFDVIAPQLDIRYMHAIADSLYAGPHLRNQFGRGSLYKAIEPERWDYVVSAGFALEYIHREHNWEPSIFLGSYLDLNNQERRVITYLAGVGLAFGKSSKSLENPKPEPQPEIDQKVEIESSSPPVTALAPEPKEPIVVTLNAELLNFDLGKSTIKSDSQLRMKKLGRVLAAMKEVWRKLIISGHTDRSGRRSTNERLSNDRAQALCSIFLGEGVALEKLDCKGYADDRLLPGYPANAAIHRRVELIFEGVNPERSVELKAAIDSAIH